MFFFLVFGFFTFFFCFRLFLNENQSHVVTVLCEIIVHTEHRIVIVHNWNVPVKLNCHESYYLNECCWRSYHTCAYPIIFLLNKCSIFIHANILLTVRLFPLQNTGTKLGQKSLSKRMHAHLIFNFCYTKYFPIRLSLKFL